MPLLIRLYTSSPAAIKLAELGLSGSFAAKLVLLPLTALPAPQPQRRLSLSVEQGELRHELALIDWQLAQFATGRFRPDAGREHGLQADKEALAARLRAIERALAAQKGGAP